MSSLSSFFEKRQKKQTGANLSSLFSNDASQRFQKLEEDTKKEVINLPPQPKKSEPEDLTATIFVGNVPVDTKRKDLRKLFGQWGTISKIWLRSVPVEVDKRGKKANFILGNIQQGADSMNCYVKFEDSQSMEKACSLNATRLGSNTLRVFPCLQDNLDYQSTVFVGNLAFDVRQEELRNHFSSIGQITNVRVVKNKQTMQGIGIGYVRFANKEQMFQALRTMNGSELRGRQIRVKRAVAKEKLDKKVNKVWQKRFSKPGYTPPKALRKRNQAGQAAEAKKEEARRFHFKRKMIAKK